MDANGSAGQDLDVPGLVEQARQGDRIAFGKLIETHQEDIFRMVYFRTQSQMDAEDLTQEIFLKAYNSLMSLKEPSLFRPWLYRIAVNRVHDHHRRRRFLSFFMHSPSGEEETDPMMNIRETAEDAHTTLEKREFWNKVRNFMDRLSSQEREVFQLRFLDHLGIAEISEVMGKNESTIKTHLYRAIKKFQGDEILIALVREECT